jgi:hypothetical protein
MKKLILIFVILVSVSACSPEPIETKDTHSGTEGAQTDIDKGDVRPPGSQR